MIKRLLALFWADLCDLFPVYLEPLDKWIPPDMAHLLDKME